MGAVAARVCDGPHQDPTKGRPRHTAQRGPAQPGQLGPESTVRRVQPAVCTHPDL